MKPARLPSIKDVILWFREAGFDPVVRIDYAARKVTIHPKSENDVEPTDPLASDIERAFGGG